MQVQYKFNRVYRWGNSGNSVRLYFFGLQNHCRCDYSHEIKRRLFNGHPLQYSCLENPMGGGVW